MSTYKVSSSIGKCFIYCENENFGSHLMHCSGMSDGLLNLILRMISIIENNQEELVTIQLTFQWVLLPGLDIVDFVWMTDLMD